MVSVQGIIRTVQALLSALPKEGSTWLHLSLLIIALPQVLSYFTFPLYRFLTAGLWYGT